MCDFSEKDTIATAGPMQWILDVHIWPDPDRDEEPGLSCEFDKPSEIPAGPCVEIVPGGYMYTIDCVKCPASRNRLPPCVSQI